MRSSGAGAPVFGLVALADIFVCAIAVVLIMLLLVQSGRSQINRIPMADITLICRDSAAGPGSVAPPNPDGAVEVGPSLSTPTLAAMLKDLPGSASLSVRVLLANQGVGGACQHAVEMAVEDLNSGFDAREGKIERLILLEQVPLEVLAPADGPSAPVATQ